MYRGIQLFNENSYKEALLLFVEGKKSSNIEINQKCRYWEAETTYMLQDYETAFIKFSTLNRLVKQKKCISSIVELTLDSLTTI